MKYSQLIFLLKLQLLAIMKLYKTRHACSFLFIYLFFYKQSDTAWTCLVKKKKKTNRLILASFWLFCLFLWISANTGRNKRFGQHALSDLEQWNQIICRKKKKQRRRRRRKHKFKSVPLGGWSSATSCVSVTSGEIKWSFYEAWKWKRGVRVCG